MRYIVVNRASNIAHLVLNPSAYFMAISVHKTEKLAVAARKLPTMSVMVCDDDSIRSGDCVIRTSCHVMTEKRNGPGRPTIAADGSRAKPRKVCLTDSDWSKLQALGGAEWVRRQIAKPFQENFSCAPRDTE